MQEDYLHYLWKFKLLNTTEIVTTSKKKIEILNWGTHNKNSGPDFFNAKVKIGETIWAGNIEIHIKSSDWNAHKHQNDRAYDNVILHVVYQHDKEITDSKNRRLETLELKEIINHTEYSKFKTFIEKPLPCLSFLEDISDLNILNFKEKMLFERLERKSLELTNKLTVAQYDWEEVFYQQMAKAMGMKVNGLPFEVLAKNTPIKVLKKLDDLIQIESILLGQAGFLTGQPSKEESVLNWVKEYEYQQVKNKLVPLDETIWKFSRLRPSNFPTIRIAQLARVLFQESNLFDRLVKGRASLETIHEIFDVKIKDGFWLTHYTFKNESIEREKAIGKTLLNSIIINTIVPFLFVYGKYKQADAYVEYALKLLSQVKGEQNSIVAKFDGKINVENAADSQALIESYTSFCNKKKCLDCSIGINILAS